MNYGYIRVSTKQQKIDRQLEEIKNAGIEEKNIFIDKESGKDFNRKNYQRLVKKLKKGDLVIIKSIDRLGRNYQMIIDEWSKITKAIGADIKVLDMPLLDTSAKDNNLIGMFISDIVLQILSFVAENERKSIKERQAEGIRLAKQKGVKFGRPSKQLPLNYKSVLLKYTQKKIDITDAMFELNISRSTFYKIAKSCKRRQTLPSII